MDEVDNIIIQSLSQICDINKNESISKLTPEVLVQIVAKCLSLIKPSLEIPKFLPTQMAQRFAIATTLSEACVSIGFKGDIGYQTFLYSNATEVRRMLMFLIEKLPRVQHSSNELIYDKKDEVRILKNRILENFKSQQKKPWTSDFCKNVQTKNEKYSLQETYQNHNFQQLKSDESDVCIGDSESLSKIFQYIDYKNLIPSLIHTNEIQLLENKPDTSALISKISSLEQSTELSAPKSITAVQIPETSIINALVSSNTSNNLPTVLQVTSTTSSIPLSVSHKSDIENLKDSIQDKLVKINILKGKSEETKEKINDEKKNLLILSDKKKIHERIEVLLDNPEVNLTKMESVLNATIERSKKFEQQWEKHKADLTLAIDTANGKFSNEHEHLEEISRNIISTQLQVQEISKDYKNKKILHTQLVSEMEAENNKADRKVYTSRILEIIGNIFKQKKDIDNILKDTRELQKVINNLTGQLDRQFAVTDDLIYKKAKSDEPSRKCYKLLATLHSTCEELLELVKDNGCILREIRDVEDQIEFLKAKNISANLENITHDLEQMIIERKKLQNL